MKNILKSLAIALIFMLIGAIVSYFLVKGHFQAKLEALKPQEVEVIQIDTIRVLKPIEIEKRILVRDTIAIAIVDTLWKTDTLFLPREEKVYADSSYRCVVSGIEPRLDTIEVYQKTIIETKIATQKEWRKFDYGVQIGVGLVCPINSHPNFGFYTGFGLTYHF